MVKRIAISLTAICLVTVALSACQDMAIQYYNMGIDAIEEGDTASAVEYFEKSLGIRENDPDAHMNLGVALYGVGDYDRALRELRIAAEDYPSDPVLHYNIAEVYAALGQFQAATTEYEYALRLSPDFVEAHSALGKLLMDGGHYAAAESHFYDALALVPSHSDTQLRMGWLYVYIGKYNEATHYFYRGLQKQPRSAYGRLGLAMSQVKRGDYEEALKEYKKVSSWDRRNADALLGIGVCQLNLGRLSQAQKAIENSIEVRADNPEAYKTLADLYAAQDQYAEAIASYRMAVVQQEDFADAHLGLGRTLETVGHLTEAEEALQKALYHDPDNPQVLYRLGQLYLLKDDRGLAQSYLEMAMDKAAGNVELENTIRNALKSLSERE